MNTKLLKHSGAILGIILLLFFSGFFLVVFAGWWAGDAHTDKVSAIGFIFGSLLAAFGTGAYLDFVEFNK